MAQAGRLGAVTVATNMAGQSTYAMTYHVERAGLTDHVLNEAGCLCLAGLRPLCRLPLMCVRVCDTAIGRGTDILLGGNPATMAKLRVRDALVRHIHDGIPQSSARLSHVPEPCRDVATNLPKNDSFLCAPVPMPLVCLVCAPVPMPLVCLVCVRVGDGAGPVVVQWGREGRGAGGGRRGLLPL